MSSRPFQFDTRVIHSGEPRPPIDRAVTMPIYQSSTYVYGGEKEYDDLKYIRLNNTPNHISLAKKLADLEGAAAGLVTASGMAAISTTLLALVGEGEHLLAQESLYGGTHHFLHEHFVEMGRQVSFFSEQNLERLDQMVQPKTRAVYVESVSNPLLRIPNFEKIVSFCKRKGVLSIIDNTFPSPVNFNPISLGLDIVVHSATKYLNGHTDIVGGCALGSGVAIRKITKLLNHLGGSMDPHTCFLLQRGLKTLGVRVRQQNQTALKLAEALEQSGRIKHVIYPGLKSHPNYELARKYFRGFGGMVSFEYPGTAREADSYLNQLIIPLMAPSLGGVESLITRPVTTSHSGIPKEALDELGVTDILIRVSVGLEDADDLIQDFLGPFR